MKICKKQIRNRERGTAVVEAALMMPWMALVPDISGVCSTLGTLEMTS